MSWLKKLLPPKIKRESQGRKSIPEGLWSKCPACEAVLYRSDLESNQNVCPKCGHHQRIGARQRIELLLDAEGQFEIGAEVVLKATKVDGIYSADPNKDPNATRYSRISFDEAIVRRLEVMDATAFALCRDQKLPIKVFSINKPGALRRVVCGEDEGTLVQV